MQLIFGKENADMLRERFTILDLETVEKDGVSIDVYCLIPAEKIGIPDLPKLDQWKKLHHEFIQGYQDKHYSYCRQCIEHLKGQFGGEVDTFYDEILRRINEAEAEV